MRTFYGIIFLLFAVHAQGQKLSPFFSAGGLLAKPSCKVTGGKNFHNGKPYPGLSDLQTKTSAGFYLETGLHTRLNTKSFFGVIALSYSFINQQMSSSYSDVNANPLGRIDTSLKLHLLRLSPGLTYLKNIAGSCNLYTGMFVCGTVALSDPNSVTAAFSPEIGIAVNKVLFKVGYYVGFGNALGNYNDAFAVDSKYNAQMRFLYAGISFYPKF